MNKLYVDPERDIISVIESVRESEDSEVQVMIDTDSPLLQNSLNLKYIERQAEKFGKYVKFVPKDDEGKEKLEKLYVTEEVKPEPGNETVGEAGELSTAVNKMGFVEGDIAKTGAISHRESPSPKTASKLAFLGVLRKRFRGTSLNRFFIVLTLLFLLTIPLGLVAVWWYVPKAVVTVNLNAQELEQSVTFAISTEVDEVDLENGVIPASVVSVEVNGREATEATGEKEVGEKASGVITISNKTDDEISLPRETIIELISGDTPEVLRYVTTEAVTVPPAEDDEVGRVDVSVEAVEIGDSYNLSADELFQVGDMSSAVLVGKNPSSITGGTSSIVSVVTQEDRDRVGAGLESNLREEAKEKLEETAGNNFVESSVNIEVVNITYSAAVGDEADTVSVEARVKAEALVIDEEDISRLADSFTPRVPTGYVLIEKESETSFNIVDVHGEPEVEVKYVSFMVRELDVNRLRGNLRGVTIDRAQEVINGYLEEGEEYSITLVPQFPESVRRMPHILDRIEVEVEYN